MAATIQEPVPTSASAVPQREMDLNGAADSPEAPTADPTDWFFLLYSLSLLVTLVYSVFVVASRFCASEQTARGIERSDRRD